MRILVDGEEDLLALLFFATYPDKTVLLYGQPNEGLVAARVEDYRRQAYTILKQINVLSRLKALGASIKEAV